MPDYIACDISEYQPLVDDTYPHKWISFRLCDGGYIDAHLTQNLAWALRSRASGRIDGFTVYVVYRPGQNGNILASLDQFSVPHDCVVMIDAETWGGQVTGDHSAELDDLASRLRSRQGGEASLVWGYGNRNDINTIWQSRPSWLEFDVASYGGGQPTPPAGDGLVGWQYTDGQYAVAGLPSSSSPFGPCDHNVFYGIGEDMPTATEIADAVWAKLVHRTDSTGKPTSGDHPASVWLTNGASFASEARDAAQATQAAQSASTGGIDVSALAQQVAADLGPALSKQFLAAFGAACQAGAA